MMNITLEDLRNIKGFGKKMEERVIEYMKKKEKEIEHNNQIKSITPPNNFKIDLDDIYCGESVEFMRRHIPSSSVDLIVTSPPYDDLREYNGFRFNYKMMLEEIYRVLDVGGVCVWVVGDATIDGSETGTSFKQALYAKEIGFNLHDTMIYEKNTSSFPASDKSLRYTQIFEYMFVFSKGYPATVNLIKDKPNRWAGHSNWGKNTARGKDGKLVDVGRIKEVPEFSPRNNIWKYVVGGGFATKDKIAHNHPAIFPEKLAEDHILSWTNEGDIILDPMCGSGTTCKMAKLNKRRYIGIDISQEYVDLSRKRVESNND